MSAINDLLSQINSIELKKRLEEEIGRTIKNKRFGLVFEEHLPECTRMYANKIKKGSNVTLKSASENLLFKVIEIQNDIASCVSKMTEEIVKFPIHELVNIAEFGEPIYPQLIPVDSVENALDSSLWHTLIEADNYHALQLLEYLYPKKVDCIYIDPPYNTGARDWKYNNDYVDDSDVYRHSKWLSMLEKRLILAKSILNPSTGVLIVTIDEHEVHHLRTLLEQIFPNFYIQMVTYVSNPTGATQGRFSRVEEYAIYCFAPNAYVPVGDDSMLGELETSKKVRWKSLLRSGTSARREDRKNMFYPVYIDIENGVVAGAGNSLPFEETPSFSPQNGYEVAWPIRTDGSLGRWSVGAETFRNLINKGYVKLGKYDAKRKTYGITYISSQTQKMVDNGKVIITGKDEKTGIVNIEYADAHNQAIRTVWYRTLHNAGAYGTELLSSMIGKSRSFSFPKSLYATKDAIAAILRNNRNALVVDFFAGSGTTLNAINLLNAEDGGSRRCIIVTNNECSEKESVELTKSGYKPGDDEWEKHGICKSVTWPRAKYSILGRREDGSLLEGEYYTSLTSEKAFKRKYVQISVVSLENLSTVTKKKQLVSLIGKGDIPQKLVTVDSKYVIPKDDKYKSSILFDVHVIDEYLDELEGCDYLREIYIVAEKKSEFNKAKESIDAVMGDYIAQETIKKPMAEGFKTNVEYFKLGFLDKHEVELGRQFKELIPILWMKAGAIGKCPEVDDANIPEMLILPENKFAILVNESHYMRFEKALEQNEAIETVYIVTDSESGYHEIISKINAKDTFQLYRDYLDNFRINHRR